MIAGPREHERAEKLEGRASTCAMLMCKSAHGIEPTSTRVSRHSLSCCLAAS